MRNVCLIIPLLLLLVAACTTHGQKDGILGTPQEAGSASIPSKETDASLEELEQTRKPDVELESVPPPESAPTPETATAIPAIQFVNSAREGGAGPLTKESVSIGGLRIGDSQESAIERLGEPSFIQESGWGTQFVHWHYEQHNVYIDFYRTAETEPVGGVASIVVNAPSTLKTDKDVGIGDDLAAILQAYDHVLVTEETDGVMNVYINGTHEEERFYVPQLHFLLEHGRITHFELTTNLIDPEHVP